ncbi:Salivary acidic proline-rich phosphoprotein 1/2 [Binucleata daphniae]
MNFLDNLHFIKQQKNDLVTFFANNKVSIVKGPTGCGKSTYIPYILQNHSIVLVEPRRIAVKSIYNSLKDKIENLSYKMRFDSFTCAKLQNLKKSMKKSMKGSMKVTCECNKKTDTDKQNITDGECSSTHVDRCKNTCKAYKKMLNTSNVEIVTDGIFLNNLDKYLTYEYIIIDEVHERSAKTDLILGILKQKLKNKLILMSATINTRIFEKYFDGKVFEIIGQSYKANVMYESVDDYIIGSFLKIKEIVSNESDKQNNKNSVHTNKHNKQLQAKNNDDEKNGTLIDKCNLQKSSTCSDNKDVDSVIDEIFDIKTPAEFDATNKNGDILVFLTGEEDINELYKLVRTIPQIKAYKIHSLLSDKKQNEIFEHTPLTKVILSTNICETSITIPGIKYVIDCGLAKEKIYNGCLHLGIKK